MSPTWYYVQGNERLGPLAFEELRGIAVSGRLGPDDLVWTDGMADWQPARSVEGLFGRSGTAAAISEEPGPAVNPYESPGETVADIYPARPVATGTPGIVIAGFVFSLIGILICVVFSFVGLVLSAIGLPEANRRGGAGKGLAIAGIVIGALGVVLVLGIIVVVFMVDQIH